MSSGSGGTTLDENEQESVATVVGLLEAKGPQLPFPYSSSVEGSRHGHMRELRVQHTRAKALTAFVCPSIPGVPPFS